MEALQMIRKPVIAEDSKPSGVRPIVCVCVYSVTESLILVSKGAGGDGILRESLPNNTLGVKLTPVRLHS